MNIGIVEITVLLCGIGFLVLVFSLLPLIHSLTRASKEIEKTVSESRDTIQKIDDITERIDKELDSVDDIIINSLKTLKSITNTLNIVNKHILKPSFKIFSLIPAVKFGWDFVAKRKKSSKKED